MLVCDAIIVSTISQMLHAVVADVMIILSLVGDREQWRSQPKNLGGAKMCVFMRITLFCLENRLSKHKMTIFSKNWGAWPLWLRL